MKEHKKIRDIALFGMLAALMLAGKIVMEALPNIHPVTMMVMVCAAAYGFRGLIPVAVFIAISGLFYGFDFFWFMYLYIFPLYGVITALIPRTVSEERLRLIYPLLCGFFGLIYGTLSAPVWAYVHGYTWEMTLNWIIAGIPFDLLHLAGNLAMGLLILPLTKLIRRLDK